MAFTKAMALKIVNPAAAVVVAVQLVTAGLFLFFSESIPFGLVRQVHLVSGCTLFALIFLHTSLNWTWVKSTFFKKKR